MQPRSERRRQAMRRLICTGLWLLAAVFPALATHIVGGELNYSRLGGNQFLVELKVYKDCGTSIVPFDNPAVIYVYRGSGSFDFSFEMDLVERDTLDAALPDPCLILPPEVCVDYAHYQAVVTLPPSQTGYTLAYIRCCRTNAILNAEGEDVFGNPIPPDLIGATYSARVPASATLNSNPVFREFPPILLCSGQDISVDQSATDADGDQLVYSLCTPNVGGSLTAVFGNPNEETPPFETINWVPPYGLGNVLGSDPPLRINAVTGRLTGRAPEAIGQYVVGVCVQEFRNGVLLSENKRDFQFNVGECLVPVRAEFGVTGGISLDTVVLTAPPITYLQVCDTVPAVQFVDLSLNADSLIWNFGDGSPPVFGGDPYHVFPDTGLYLVSLIGDPGQACTDTFLRYINIQYQRIEAAFSFGPSECYLPAEGLAFTDASQPESAAASWAWQFGDGGSSGLAGPVHFYSADGDYPVSLEVTDRNGCRSRTDTLLRVLALDIPLLADTVALCGGDTVLLELEINGEHTFAWSPAATLSDAAAQQPLAFPAVSTTYGVEILTTRESGTVCRQTDSVHVLADYPRPALSLLTDTLQCDTMVSLAAVAPGAMDWTWSRSRGLAPVISRQPAFTVYQPESEAWYYVEAANAWCTALDSVQVGQRAVVVRAADVAVCAGDEAVLQAGVASNGTGLTYTWNHPPPAYETETPVTAFIPEAPVTVTFLAANAQGCTQQAFIAVDVLALPEPDITVLPESVVNTQAVQFDANIPSAGAWQWEPAGLFDDPASGTPTAVISGTTLVIVTVTAANGCSARDSIIITATDIPCGSGQIFVPSAFSPNNDGLNDVFRLQGTVIESLTLEIFDRWGNPVFVSDDINLPWDGTFQGRPLAADVYGYVLRVDCYGDQGFIDRGSITLMR